MPITAEQLVFAKLVAKLGVGLNLLDTEVSKLTETLHNAMSNIHIESALHQLKEEHQIYQEDAIQLAATKIVQSLV